MATFLFDNIIFGPVASRRLGTSLGINLLPNDAKNCNFNCVYCECGWTFKDAHLPVPFHPFERFSESLDNKLKEMKLAGRQLDVITFAGNGEPTMHPDFEDIIDETIRLRNLYFPQVKIAVLSNATMIFKEGVRASLQKIEMNILKLDSGIDETIQLVNQPLVRTTVERLITNLKKFNGNCTIQTMFLKGNIEGKAVDNSSEIEVNAWLNAIAQIAPKEVMLYSIARDTPSTGLEKVSLERMQSIAKEVENLGIKALVTP